MAGNKSLNAAAAAKQDEFYVQLTDIGKELRRYRKRFQRKTVLCNCDDSVDSNFFRSEHRRTVTLEINRIIDGRFNEDAKCSTVMPRPQASRWSVFGFWLRVLPRTLFSTVDCVMLDSVTSRRRVIPRWSIRYSSRA